MAKPRVFDNEYVVFYKDKRGIPHKQNVKAATSFEAINNLRSRNSSAKEVIARLVKKQPPSIKNIFH